MLITKWQKLWVKIIRCIPFTTASNRLMERDEKRHHTFWKGRLKEVHDAAFAREMRKLRERQERMSLLRKISKDLDEIKSR